MRAVIQRVRSARVYTGDELLGSCDAGVLILLGVGPEDTEAEAERLCDKIVRMRIFSDPAGKMNLSLADVGGSALVVSQFTLYANCTHGNRPDFFGAAAPERANALYTCFVEKMRSAGIVTGCGRFGADMRIEPVLSGPVTIMLDTDSLKKHA